MKKTGLIFFTSIFGVAGLAHFILPNPFISAMPPFLPFPKFLNILVGIIELLLAIGFWTKYRKKVIDISILMLSIFLVLIHAWHIQIGKFPTFPDTPLYILWIRFFAQFGLIYWLWKMKD